MSTPKKNITIYDIAKLSGFSPKTVSRVLNNEAKVSPKTADKIRSICEDLNYVPNRYARNLKAKKDKTILLSVRTSKGFPTTWLQILIEEIGIQCLSEGITLITEYFYRSNDLGNSIINNAKNILDGVVLFYEQPNDIRVTQLQNQGIPYIVFGKSDNAQSPYIGNDNERSLFQVFDKLCTNGLKKSLLLLRKPTLVNQDRVLGAYHAYEKHQLDKDLINVQYNIRTAKDAHDYIKENVEKDDLPDLIFLSGDERVPGAYKALRELGVNIPEDVSVLGFDNIPMGENFFPPLTSISPDYETLSKEILTGIRQLSEQQTYSSKLVEASLNIRESVNAKYL